MCYIGGLFFYDWLVHMRNILNIIEKHVIFIR